MFNLKTKWGVLPALVLLGIAMSALADVPRIINYQGRLTDTEGNPVSDGSYYIKFVIYRSESGVDSLWSSGFQAVTVVDGLFSYALGSNVSFPAGIFGPGITPFLGITIGTDAEINPRTAFTSSAFAWHSNSADTATFASDVGDGSITDAKLAMGAVTQDKIDIDAVNSAHIQNGTILLQDIEQNGAVANQIIKWDGSAWVTAEDIGGDGDITEVTAGDGLAGGGESGAVTLSVEPDGITSIHIGDDAVGTSEIMDGSILLHDMNQNGAGANQVIKWDGSAWVTADDIGGDGDITEVTAGDGLAGGGESGAVALSVEPDGITSSHIGSDAVGTSEIMDGSILLQDIDQNGATVNQVIKWDGSAWVTAEDIGGDGDITGVTAGGGLIGGGTSGHVTLAVGPGSITSTHIATDAVGTSEIEDGSITTSDIMDGSITGGDITDGTIVDADISSLTSIATSKIYGTAMNLVSNQTVTGTKFFNGGSFYVGDSIMYANTSGVIFGTRSYTPTSDYVLNVVRDFDATGNRRGINVDVENDGGHVYGVCSVVESGSDYYAYGGYFSAAGSVDYRRGVYGTCGISNGDYGASFYGNVEITGVYSKAAGGFKIDHPQDPGNMYLRHADVSSPEMKNVYDGVAVLDANGEATVELPSYFESLNESFRYQLTPIGASMPDLFIAQKIDGNRFMISGGKPLMEVSWQVTGVRKDAFAKSEPVQVEVVKNADEQGLYQNPEIYGYGIEKAVDYKYQMNAEEGRQTQE